MFVDFLKFFEAVNMDGSFLMRRSMSHLDFRFKSHGILKISDLLRACSHPLSMQQILPETAKICPKIKLSITTKNRDFSVSQK
jgi:hypothetical protein